MVVRGSRWQRTYWFWLVGDYGIRACHHTSANNAKAATFELAISDVRCWLTEHITLTVVPGLDHLQVREMLMSGAGRGGELTPDVQLAALEIENGGTAYPQDADFACFHGIRWINPRA